MGKTLFKTAKKHKFLEVNIQEIHQYFSNILSVIESDNDINIVNKTYLSEILPLLATFKEDMTKFYFGKFEQVDFLKKEEVAQVCFLNLHKSYNYVDNFQRK